MVFTCIIINCKNSSIKPDCLALKWHRIPTTSDTITFAKIKRHLKIPELTNKKIKNVRICSECINKIPKSRKSPFVRKSLQLAKSPPLTRSELCRRISHDHTYCQSAHTDPSVLSTVKLSESVAIIPENPLPTPRLKIEDFSSNDAAIRFYTYFESYEHFMICFQFLGDAVNHLNYQGQHCSSNTIRTKTQRTLSPKNEFFLTLCRLRCNLLVADLAYRFQVSHSTISRIFTTWVNFLYHKFKEIPIWPSKSQVQSSMPTQFRQLYPNTRIIIDATEIFIQKPTEPIAQQLTFSSYKNHNTGKVLAGITPSGAFSFISPMYGGSISDRQLFIESGLLEKLDPGDSIMADKGFNISDILECNGVTLNIPPRKNDSQLSEKELIETRRKASLRIHIERAFKRVKDFKILDIIPNNMAGLSSELFFVCAMLTNFGRPLVTDKR